MYNVCIYLHENNYICTVKHHNKRCKSKRCSKQLISKFENVMNTGGPKLDFKPAKKSRKKPKGLKMEPLCQKTIRRVTYQELIQVNMCNYLNEKVGLKEFCKGRKNSHRCITCEGDGRNHMLSKYLNVKKFCGIDIMVHNGTSTCCNDVST